MDSQKKRMISDSATPPTPRKRIQDRTVDAGQEIFVLRERLSSGIRQIKRILMTAPSLGQRDSVNALLDGLLIETDPIMEIIEEKLFVSERRQYAAECQVSCLRKALQEAQVRDEMKTDEEEDKMVEVFDELEGRGIVELEKNKDGKGKLVKNIREKGKVIEDVKEGNEEGEQSEMNRGSDGQIEGTSVKESEEVEKEIGEGGNMKQSDEREVN